MTEFKEISKILKQYNQKFNKDPKIINKLWREPEKLYYSLRNAIETNTPYDEYELLTDEEKIAFDKGMLLF